MTMSKTKLPKNYDVIIDKEQITDLLRLCDEATTREIIGEDDPWKTQKHCGFGRTETKCYP